MGEFDINKAKEFVRQKESWRREENHICFEKAWKDFDRIAAMLIEKYNPIRIYQWGSLLNENNFSDISDIDIAVEGINSAEEYFSMLGEALKLTGFPLDLVQIEKIESLYAEDIKKYGRLVYERK